MLLPAPYLSQVAEEHGAAEGPGAGNVGSGVPHHRRPGELWLSRRPNGGPKAAAGGGAQELVHLQRPHDAAAEQQWRRGSG